MDLTPYHAKYFAYELTKRCASDSIQKLAAVLTDAQVDLNPHQLEAALFAFRSPLSNGAILADEVGLGKTIEAGLVIAQRWAERKRKILIIVPSNLRKQWYQELLDKFFLPSVILESKSFNQEIKNGNLNPLNQKHLVICSYQFARAKEPYIRQIPWDLVIIDEAHRLRNVYKPSNKIANTLKTALQGFHKILLTATPLQNSLLELYGLISIIDGHIFGDLPSFKSQFSNMGNDASFKDLKERLKPICKRTLRRQVLEYIKYTNRIPITQEFYPTEEEQKLYDLVSGYLQSEILYALPKSQRQLMTLILRKLLSSSTFAISGTLEALANKLENIIAQNEVEQSIADNYDSYDELKDEWIDDEEELGETKETQVLSPEVQQGIKDEIKSLREFCALARSIQKNSKGEVLLTALSKGFAAAESNGASKKAIIFTESTRTQQYLKQILNTTEYRGKIVLFNGSNNDTEAKEIYQRWLDKHRGTDRITGSRTADIRAALIEHFRDEAVIMIATEAGAEGVNLQFCSLIVNYDLPWNPQRIEQRIGRCHRYGQKHDVVVVNFLNKKNAADQRVFELLAQKFKLFEGVFGASDEVLGAIESGVDFEKRIVQICQQCRTEQEIQSCFDALQQEMETKIEENINHAREQLLENFDEEVHEKLRISYEESKDYFSKYERWLWDITRFYLKDYAIFSNDEKSFTLNNNPFPHESIHPGPYKLGKNVEDVNIYRIGHPLAQKVIEQCRKATFQNETVTFKYTNNGLKISVLEPFVGDSGWMAVRQYTINSFETEDYILLAAISDRGDELDPEICRRLFSLSAEVTSESPGIDRKSSERIEKMISNQENDILDSNADRNTEFFETEIEKLDKWAEDVKNSLELELKELDREIKATKTEAKKLTLLEEKVKKQREIKEMEKRRNFLRQELFQKQDEIDKQKGNIIDHIEARLKQKIIREELFLTRWNIL